jgi:hypothetical protein
MNQNLPEGMTEEEVRAIAEYYDNLTEEEWLALDEEAENREGYSWVQVPTELMPAIRKLLAEHDEQQRKLALKTKRKAR